MKSRGRTRERARARGWVYGLGAAGALALLVIWVTLASRPAPRTDVGRPKSSMPRYAGRAPESRAPAPAPTGVTPGTPYRAGASPVIDDVIVEKPAPCNGEETLVTVRAHTPDNTDAELHYLIGPGTGQSVPLRAWLDERGNSPEFQLTVFGKDNVSTTQALPPLHVRPCRLGSFAMLSHRSLPNHWGAFEFRAQLREPATGEHAPARARARRYSWSFGDGTRAETRSGEVTHSYEDRPQQTLYSQFLVRVEVDTGAAEPLVARDALQLPNPAHESWSRKGIVSLMVTLEPTFPTLSASGRVEQGVRLRHYRPEPVVIESVRKVSVRSDGTGQSAAEPVDVVALLGTDTIPAGHGLDLHVALDTSAQPEVLSVTYYLKGESAEGRSVVGSFSVMRPPPRPRADNSTPVTDRLLAAKIRRARDRLNKEMVSDEDLARLERQGEFQDL